MSSRTSAKKPIASASQKFFQSVAPLSGLSAEKYGNPRLFPVDLHGVQHTNARLNPHDVDPYLLTVKQAAERLVADLTAQGVFDDPIVTEIEPLDVFYAAEDYHQEYFARNPEQPYCAAVIAPKVSKLRRHYMERLAA